MKKSFVSLILFYLTYFCIVPAYGFSTHSTVISWAFDKVYAVVGESITVTVSIANHEADDMRGFYFTEQIPLGLSISTVSVKIDGSNISYIAEPGLSGGVYPDYSPYRWTLELPPTFGENNPISKDSLLEIVYTIVSSKPGPFSLAEFNWAGYYPSALVGEKAAFGHFEEDDNQVLYFFATLTFDFDDDGDVDSSDLSAFIQYFGGSVADISAFSAAFGR